MTSQEKIAKLTHPRNWRQFPLASRSLVGPGNQGPQPSFWDQPQKAVLNEICALFKYKALEGPSQ